MGIRFENFKNKTYTEFLISWKSLREGLLLGVDTTTLIEDKEIVDSLVFFIGPILVIFNKGEYRNNE